MISSREDLRRYVDDDLRSVGRLTMPMFCRVRMPALFFVVLLRRTEYLKNTQRSPLSKIRYVLARWRLSRLAERLGFSIPLNVFGPGLSIAHTGTIVVNGHARVGSFCRIHPGVTIGAVRGLAPVIGDHVFLAPGSGVYGDVSIGDRSHIGPNVVVTNSVDEDSILFPARAEVRVSKRGPWLNEVTAAKATSVRKQDNK